VLSKVDYLTINATGKYMLLWKKLWGVPVVSDLPAPAVVFSRLIYGNPFLHYAGYPWISAGLCLSWAAP
jgi:hypothetical protein